MQIARHMLLAYIVAFQSRLAKFEGLFLFSNKSRERSSPLIFLKVKVSNQSSKQGHGEDE